MSFEFLVLKTNTAKMIANVLNESLQHNPIANLPKISNIAGNFFQQEKHI